MSTIVCKECGFSYDNKAPGMHFCPNCAKKMKFFKFEAFCGAKPNELHDRT